MRGNSSCIYSGITVLTLYPSDVPVEDFYGWSQLNKGASVSSVCEKSKHGLWAITAWR